MKILKFFKAACFFLATSIYSSTVFALSTDETNSTDGSYTISWPISQWNKFQNYTGAKAKLFETYTAPDGTVTNKSYIREQFEVSVELLNQPTGTYYYTHQICGQWSSPVPGSLGAGGPFGGCDPAKDDYSVTVTVNRSGSGGGGSNPDAYPPIHSACVGNTNASFGDIGSGTASNPYMLCSVKMFKEFLVENQDFFLPEQYYHVAIGNNMNLSNSSWPIFERPSKFEGTLNGNNYIIENLTQNLTDSSTDYPFVYAGLLGSFHNAEIKNMKLKNFSLVSYVQYLDLGALATEIRDGQVSNVHLIGDDNSVIASSTSFADVGGLVGSAARSSFINVSSNSFVQSHDTVGGLVGTTIEGYFDNARSSGDVFRSETQSGSGDAGGLIGVVITRNADVVIKNSSSSTNVSGYPYYSGGLIGYVTSEEGVTVTIENSHASGDVSGKDAGGLVGNIKYAEIIRSFATGDVEAKYKAGGLVGNTFATDIRQSYSSGSISGDGTTTLGGLVASLGRSSVRNSYSTGDVYLERGQAGGLIGRSDTHSVIQNSFSVAYLAGEANSPNSIGGLVGGFDYTNSGSITNSFWNTSINVNSSFNTKGTGVSENAMKNKSTFTQKGWDFTGESANGTANIWTISSNTNCGYPYLKALGSTSQMTCSNFITVSAESYGYHPSQCEEFAMAAILQKYPSVTNISVEIVQVGTGLNQPPSFWCKASGTVRASN